MSSHARDFRTAPHSAHARIAFVRSTRTTPPTFSRCPTIPVRLGTVHSPPIDAIRLIFAEAVGDARGEVSRVYDVGGQLYARATLPGRDGDLVGGVALKVLDAIAEVRPAATWAGGTCALIETQMAVGRVVELGGAPALTDVRDAVRACVQPAVFEDVIAERHAAAAQAIEHPGNVVLSLITALSRAGGESERLLPLLPAIMDRVHAVTRPTDWAAVQAVAAVAASVTDETTRWHLDVLAGRLLLIRPSTGRQAWAG